MAKKNILVHLDLHKNELQNAVLQNLAIDPANGVEGQKYYNVTFHRERIFSDGIWKDVSGEIEPATTTTLGGIKVGTHLYMTGPALDVLTVNEASTTRPGVIRIATDTEASAGLLESVAVTPAQLADAIQSLPGSIQFKGSVGTGGTIEWSALPSAASSEGYEYIVITAHNTDPVCEVGDVIISNGTEWVVIPSGTSAGTVTSVGMTVPTGLEVANSPITDSGVFDITLATGYEIPTTKHVQNFGILKDSANNEITASNYNDMVVLKATGSAFIGVGFSASQKVVTVSSTDEKVLQVQAVSDQEIPVLLKRTANSLQETNAVRFSNNITVNPITGSITANYFIGNGSQLEDVPVGEHIHGNLNYLGQVTNEAIEPSADDPVLFARILDNGALYKSELTYNTIEGLIDNEHSHKSLTLSLEAQTYTNSDNGPTLQLPATEPWSGSRTPAAHNHGNLKNNGTISSSVAIGSGDAIVVVDSSSNNALVRSTTVFDGVSEDKILAQKGTWVSYGSSSILSMLNEQNRTVAYKQVFENPALTSSNGQCTWTQTHMLGSDVIATVKEASSGEEVFCRIIYGNNSLLIKINSTADIPAGVYKVVLVG